MAEEAFILLFAEPCVDEYVFFTGVHQEASDRPAAEVVVIRRDQLNTNCFKNHPKHSAAIKFEVACLNRNYFQIKTRFAAW